MRVGWIAFGFVTAALIRSAAGADQSDLPGNVSFPGVGTRMGAERARSLGDLTGNWQLFVDDALVAEKVHVTRTYHAFSKHADNPVLVADQPWEGSTVYVYGTVLPGEDGSGYRMWYNSWQETIVPGEEDDFDEFHLLYAVSNDGIKWDKPELGLVSHKGSKKNNILLRRTPEDCNPQVIHTPWESDTQFRYKLINFDYGLWPPKHTVTGYYGAYSGDGIHWTDAANNPVLPDHPGDVGNFVWDPHTRRYAGYPKKFADVRGVRRRCVGYSATTAFEKWPASKLILVPDEFDDRWVAKKGQRTDFYGLCGFAYESIYIGFLWVFRIMDGKKDGPIFVELVSSRDGINWTRQEKPRPPILSPGPDGAWDDGVVYTTNHPLVEDETIKLYYGGFDHAHGGGGTAAVGLATLRKDGFASLDAGSTTGTVTTKKLLGAAGRLLLNYKATGGWVKVEVLDANGKVVPGYNRDDCSPLKGNSTNQPVTWKKSNRLPETKGPLQLQFILKNASLYSFEAGNSVRVK